MICWDNAIQWRGYAFSRKFYFFSGCRYILAMKLDSDKPSYSSSAGKSSSLEIVRIYKELDLLTLRVHCSG